MPGITDPVWDKLPDSNLAKLKYNKALTRGLDGLGQNWDKYAGSWDADATESSQESEYGSQPICMCLNIWCLRWSITKL